MLLKCIATDALIHLLFFMLVFTVLIAQGVREGVMEIKGQISCSSSVCLKESGVWWLAFSKWYNSFRLPEMWKVHLNPYPLMKCRSLPVPQCWPRWDDRGDNCCTSGVLQGLSLYKEWNTLLFFYRVLNKLVSAMQDVPKGLLNLLVPEKKKTNPKP